MKKNNFNEIIWNIEVTAEKEVQVSKIHKKMMQTFGKTQ
jgi:hypothetical protein